MHTTHRLIALSAVLVSLAACETTSLFQGNPDEESPAAADFKESETPLTGSEYDALWDRADHVLSREGYAVDRSRSSYVNHMMVTHWDTTLAPTRFEGKRNRAWVQIRETKPGAYVVGVCVQVQQNVDIDAPSEQSQAQWEPDPKVKGVNAARAGIILWKIESGLRPEDVGETR